MALVIFTAALYCTVSLGGIQFSKFGLSLKGVFGGMFKKNKTAKGQTTPFQAMASALGGSVGTGNIAGVAAALSIGGPGSVFWMWVSAAFGMAVKFSEIVLAVRYREKTRDGGYNGGPMYYIINGLGKRYFPLAAAFCMFGASAAFGIGNAVQVGNIVQAVRGLAGSILPGREINGYAVAAAVGIGSALLSAVVLIGGAQRLGKASAFLVPFMSLGYIFCCLAVIAANLDMVMPALGSMVLGAFSPESVIGGGVGISIKTCMSIGVVRGVFSNEAGLGSSPIAHASSSEKNPVKQGFYGIFEVFADTIVICTLTALAILVSGVPVNYGQVATVELNALAFGTVFGDTAGHVIIALSMSLFALSSLLTWGAYGKACTEFLFGGKGERVYRSLFALSAAVFAFFNIDTLWQLSDILNCLMAVPNIIAVVLLLPEVKRESDYFFRAGTNEKTRIYMNEAPMPQ